MSDPMELRLGATASMTRTVTEADVERFAEVTGDANPVHLDEEYAQGTSFRGRIAHGMLTAGYVSAVLGTRLPGPGAIYMEQSLSFLAPVRPGDEITATVEVIELGERRRVRFKTTCTNQRGEEVLAGEALLKAPRSSTPPSTTSTPGDA